MVISSLFLFNFFFKKDEEWRKSPEWRKAKKLCLKKHGYKCAITGKRGLLHVHHLYNAKDHPNKIFNQTNLVPIKPSHHKKIHMACGGYDKKCTKKDYDNYVNSLTVEPRLLAIIGEQLDFFTFLLVVCYVACLKGVI